MALKLEDFRSPGFDKQRIVKRKVRARPTSRVAVDDDGDDDEYFDDDMVLRRDGDDLEEDPDFRAERRNKRVEDAYEGTTFTDDYNEVGFTYYLSDGMLVVKNATNEELYKGIISTPEGFEKALKKVDLKVRKLRKRK